MGGAPLLQLTPSHTGEPPFPALRIVDPDGWD
jgi:hypothetical protein